MESYLENCKNVFDSWRNYKTFKRLTKEKKKINLLIEELEKEIDFQNTHISDLEKDLKQYKIEQQEIPKIKNDLCYINLTCNRHTNSMEETEKKRQKIIQEINQSACLKGIKPNLNIVRIKELDQKYETINGELEEKRQERSILRFKLKKLEDKNFIPMCQQKLYDLKQSIKELKSKCLSIKYGKKKEMIEHLILQIKLKPQYEVYAEEYNIEYDLEDPEDLFIKCNEHHHLTILDGYETYTHCYDSHEYNYEEKCSLDVIISVDWYRRKAYGECQCGLGKWENEEIPYNLGEFNINSTHCYGDMSI